MHKRPKEQSEDKEDRVIERKSVGYATEHTDQSKSSSAVTDDQHNQQITENAQQTAEAARSSAIVSQRENKDANQWEGRIRNATEMQQGDKQACPLKGTNAKMQGKEDTKHATTAICIDTW